MLMFSALLAFTDVYDGTFMRYFITIYNFAVLGVLALLSDRAARFAARQAWTATYSAIVDEGVIG